MKKPKSKVSLCLLAITYPVPEKIVSDDPNILQLLQRYEQSGDESVLRNGIIDILRPQGNHIAPFSIASRYQALYSFEKLSCRWRLASKI